MSDRSATISGVKPPLKVYHIEGDFSTISVRGGEQKNPLAAVHSADRGNGFQVCIIWIIRSLVLR